MRQAARVDRNQGGIVQTLRGLGFHVSPTHRLGGGFPDLVVTGPHIDGGIVALLVEVKEPRGKLNEREKRYHADYPEGGPLIVARSADDVLEWFGRI
jgi:hypothetical protein